MNNLLDTPLFGIILSVIAYQIGVHIYSKTRFSLFNPMLIAMVIIISLLTLFSIDLAFYKKGGDNILFFLGPATIILAIPLYNQRHYLKKNFLPILAGIISGSAISVSCVILLSKYLSIDALILKSMIPKSVTLPIGIELSRILDASVPITVLATVITGVGGAVISPIVLRIVRVKSSIAKGVAMGTTSSAIGTAKALELGETEGAIGALSMGIAGIATVLLTPLLLKVLL